MSVLRTAFKVTSQASLSHALTSALFKICLEFPLQASLVRDRGWRTAGLLATHALMTWRPYTIAMTIC